MSYRHSFGVSLRGKFSLYTAISRLIFQGNEGRLVDTFLQTALGRRRK